MPDARRGSTASPIDNSKLYERRRTQGFPVRVRSRNYKIVLRETWKRFAIEHKLPPLTLGSDDEIGYVLENLGSPLFQELKERYPARAETLVKEWLEALLAIGKSDKDRAMLTVEEIQEKDEQMKRFMLG